MPVISDVLFSICISRVSLSGTVCVITLFIWRVFLVSEVEKSIDDKVLSFAAGSGTF